MTSPQRCWGSRYRWLAFVTMALLLLLVSCAEEDKEPAAYEWALPEGFPTPKVPEDNPMSAAKVELGRYLFYDTRLSIEEDTSCGTCHRQELAFTDGLDTAIGSTGERHFRNSMSLANVAYNTRLTWAHTLLDDLETQALVPMFGESPVEMGLSGREAELLEMLRSDARYQRLFAEAFPERSQPFTIQSITQAIASFQRTLISGDSPYDRHLHGDTTALSESAVRGMELFFSERLECFHCHGGFNFSDSVEHSGTAIEEIAFHNTGLYNVDGLGSYPASDTGLFEITGDPRDMGRFRAPTLRNIALTSPYFHDGSAATLEAVIDHYSQGGRVISEGENAGIGWMSPLKSTFVSGFVLTDSERADLIAFLESLTDTTFISHPDFSDPFTAPQP